MTIKKGNIEKNKVRRKKKSEIGKDRNINRKDRYRNRKRKK
jgi:hypothetical protein